MNAPSNEELLKRITIDPEICHGKPIVRGMRWPVQNVLELMASGMTNEEIITDHPELEPEDLLASLVYAMYLAKSNGHYPLMDRIV
jgi:uncharacterized protein (DUF433 family)